MNHTQFPTRSWLAALALPLVAAACTKPPPETFPVKFLAKTDGGEAITGAMVTRGATPIGQTGPDGSVQIQLSGKEGSMVSVRLACPESFREGHDDFKVPLGRVKALERRSCFSYGHAGTSDRFYIRLPSSSSYDYRPPR